MKYIFSKKKKFGGGQTGHLKINNAMLKIALVLIGFAAGYNANYVMNPDVTPQDPAVQRETPLIPKQNPAQEPVASPKQEAVSLSVCFTPNKQCQRKIINEINNAKTSIRVQAYSFTDLDIAHALVAASQRNVNVQILLDKSNRKSCATAKNILVKNKLLHIPIQFGQ